MAVLINRIRFLLKQFDLTESAERPKLLVGAIYGSIAFFLSILHNIFVLYHVDAFVSIYKIDKTSFWIGETVFLFWNSVNDPLFGWLSDGGYLSARESTKASSSASSSSLPSRTLRRRCSSEDSSRSAPTGNDIGIDEEVVLARIRALAWSGPGLSISFALLWVQWSRPSLQFAVCLCLYDGFLTLVDLHHSALLADLDVGHAQRTKLNSWCSFFSGLGSVSVFTSYLFWNREYISSFRLFCHALAFVSALGFTISCLLFRRSIGEGLGGKDSRPALTVQNSLDLWRTKLDPEYTSPSSPSSPPTPYSSTKPANSVIGQNISSLPSSSSSPADFLRQLLRQRNFFWFSAMNVLQCFHCHFNSNFFPLFVDALLQDRLSPSACSILLGLSFVIPHLNNLYFLSLCRTYGTYGVIKKLFLLKVTLALAMLAFSGPSYTWMLCAYLACNRVFTEGTCKLLTLVITDLVDEDVVLHERRRGVSALIFGTAAFLSKPGQTLAPLIGTALIAAETGKEVFAGEGSWNDPKIVGSQAISNRSGVFRILIYLPVFVAVLQLLCWSQFSLHGSRLKEVKRRRKEMAVGKPDYSFV